MDWDDGKQFGELRWRKRKGLFDEEHYPIDHVAQVRALRRFLGTLSPEGLAACSAESAQVKCSPDGTARVFALYSVKKRDAVYGWLYAAAEAAKFDVKGLEPGGYRVTWHDPWTGEATGDAQDATVKDGEALKVDAAGALKKLRAAAKAFPGETREDRGSDAAFKLLRR
jgi:hypothetical protein